MSANRPASGLQDEAAVRRSMITSIENHHPDVALKIFGLATKPGKGAAQAKLQPESAFTYAVASRAAIHLGQPDKASTLMDEARRCNNYTGNEHLQIEHLLELAEYFTLEGNYNRASTLMMDAELLKLTHKNHPDSYFWGYMIDVMQRRISMFHKKDQGDVYRLNVLHHKVLVATEREGAKKAGKLLLDVSWLLLIASARHGHDKTFNAVVQDLRSHRVTDKTFQVVSPRARELAVFVRDHDPHRQYYGRVMLRFPFLRKIITNLEIRRTIF